MPPEVAYLDSSALVKTVVREAESIVLRRFLRSVPVHASSALAATEVLRAVRRADPSATAAAHEVLRRLVVLELSEELLVDAGMLDPPDLWTLGPIRLSRRHSVYWPKARDLPRRSIHP